MPCCTHHRLVSNARVLRGDPTRTSGIVRRFLVDLRRRMRGLVRGINHFMVELDALGLEEKTTLVRLQTEREFQFRTDAGKLDAFNEWFAQQVDANVFSVPAGTDPSRPWTATYVESSYRRGLVSAYISSATGQLLSELGIGDTTLEEFLKSAFASPETISKIILLATRSFEDLKGVSSQMSAEMSRILVQGLIDGSNPRTIARIMNERIASLTRTRAETIARTEIIYAHAEGQLDAFQRLGVKEVGIKAEWTTAGDDRVCPLCEDREGQIYTIEEARGLIPLHPRCRCTWLPVVDVP